MGETSILGEMEHLVSPFCYSSETGIPEPDRTLIPKNKYLQGFISEDCRWGCLFNNASIQCFSVDTKISDYHYVPRSHVNLAIPATPYSFSPRSIITCGCEVGIHKQRSWAGSVNRILVGLDCSGVAPHYNQGGGEGALAIYDQVLQQVVKWIPLPEPVTSVKVLAHLDSGESIRPFFNGPMMAMVGIAAVGLKGGKVIIVDLGLDKTEFIPSNGMVTFASVSAPKQPIPFKIVDVNPFERLIATNRHIAIRRNELICLSVGDPQNFENSEEFIYSHPNGVEIARFDKGVVDVTALEYIPNIGCLLVGFSFGGFQLWKVDDLSLQFSSSLPEYGASVLSFGFQQPIDDPKNFCYIWILYGAQTYQMNQSKLDLYQLFFIEKTNIENFGCIYNNLQKCAKSLSITLEDVFLPTEDSVEDDIENLERYLVHPLRLVVQNELVFISWKVSRSELFYVGIFDLNQWYSSYTSARIPTAELGPFWVAIPVERTRSDGSIPWDFRLVPSSLQRWDNQYKHVDIHDYPSSITFQGICLTSRGYYSFEHFGIQEKILRIILRDGQSLMADPAILRQYCCSYGLEPKTTGIYEPELVSEKDRDRFYIFTAILESKRLSLIVKMANAWLDGSYTNVGCTIDLIIDWIKNLALAVRNLAEEPWNNVFSLSGEHMLPETKKFLSYSNFVWNSLHSLLTILMRHDEVYNVSRIPRLDGLKFSLEKLVQYSASILMFYKAGILPTVEETIEQMADYHSQRRIDVKQALTNSEIIPDEVKQNYFYRVIDQMVSALGEDFVRKEWNLEPDDPLYPPRHAGNVVNMIMWRDVDFKLISRVIFYFILDFMSAAGLPSSKLKGDFASVIRLNAEEQEEIWNIWHVDHGYFDDPLAYMAQNPKFNGRDASAASWATALTIIAGFQPPEFITGMLKMGCPPFLGKLYINLMGQSALFYKKLLNDVCTTSVMLEPDILRHFFKVAMERNFLMEFINVKLQDAPEPIPTELLSFLEKHSNFDYSSLLLAYYAKVRNIDKANQLYKLMNELWGEGRSLSSSQKEVWTFLQNTMKSWDMVKKENIVLDFLNMKRKKEVIRPPAPVITMKPRRLVSIIESSSSHERKSFTGSDWAQMSPLKKYVPKSQTVIESPENSVEDLNDSIEEERRRETRPRRSMAFDVESVLRTPVVDHRKSLAWRHTREGSVNNSHFETPPPGEDMHSILKKSDRSSRSRSLQKTRFLDPSSGQEMLSPECMESSDVFNIDGVSSGATATTASSTGSERDQQNITLPFEPSSPQSPSEFPETESQEVVSSTPRVAIAVPKLDLDVGTSDSDPNVSAAESVDSFVDADGGPSFEMSMDGSSGEAAEIPAIANEIVEESVIPIISDVTPEKESIAEAVTPPSDEGESPLSELEKNISVGDDFNLSSATTEESEPSGPENISPISTENPRSRTPEPEEFIIQSRAVSIETEIKEVVQSKPETEESESPKQTLGERSPENSFENSDNEFVIIPETPAASKYSATFESTRIDESLFTTSFHDLPPLGPQTQSVLPSVGSPNKSESVASPGTSFQDISSILEESAVNSADESTISKAILDLGPRRLTRRQKSILEKSIGTISDMGEAHLTPPKHSPVKEKSPARSAGRSRRGKSEGASSVVSELHDGSESDTSARRVTRSQRGKSNLDSSFSGSQSSLDSQPVEKTKRKTRARTLEPVHEEGSPTTGTSADESSKGKPPVTRRRKSTSSRAKSEPPPDAAAQVTTPKKRARKAGGFAPDLSTVMEVSDTSISVPTTPRELRYRKRRPSEVDSILEEREEEEEGSDPSVLEASLVTAKRTRRSMTPLSQKSSDTTPTSTPTRRRRRTSSSK